MDFSYNTIVILHAEGCDVLESVTVQSITELEQKIRSKVPDHLAPFELFDNSARVLDELPPPVRTLIIRLISKQQQQVTTPNADQKKLQKRLLRMVDVSSEHTHKFTSYAEACDALATELASSDSSYIRGQIQHSVSAQTTLCDLFTIIEESEEQISTRWDAKLGRDTNFKSTTEHLMANFKCLDSFAERSEHFWVSHFFGPMSLGGHSPGSSEFSADNDVQLQGARAIPTSTTTDSNFLRPDHCVGVAKGVLPTRWCTLRAGNALLPLDIIEFKADNTNHSNAWHRLMYEAITSAYYQQDLLDALLSEKALPSDFSRAIPFALCTLMRGRQFRMACVWHAKGHGLKYAIVFDKTLISPLDLKRAFLLRHEAINIVIKFSVALNSLRISDVVKRGPREDMWWRRFCCCKLAANEETYIQCCKCKNWFHPTCVGLAEAPPLEEEWHCPARGCNTRRVLHIKGAAEPKEDRGPRDGGDGQASTAAVPSSSLRPLRQLFQKDKCEIWLCERAPLSPDDQQLVVLKLTSSSDQGKEEARVLCQLLGVPNVVQLLDVVKWHSSSPSRSRLGLVLSYHPTDGHMVSSAQLESDRNFAQCVRQMLQAISNLHERGVVHHDISPSNVVFTAGDQSGGGTTTIIDFGLALCRPLGTTWLPYAPVGTRGFVAPEVREMATCSHKLDVWSVGALIAFQLLGVWPESNAEVDDVARLACSEAREWVRGLSPGRWWWCPAPTPYLSSRRWELVRRMLVANPEERLDAASALEQFDAFWFAQL